MRTKRKLNSKILQKQFGKTPQVMLNNVAKGYDKIPVVDGVSLSIRRGETMALIGPSGSGKTTTLRLVAGLDFPDWGEIRLGGASMSTPEKIVPPFQRSVAMVFQDLALWPHMTAAQHIEFALPQRLRKKNNLREAVARVLSLVRMEKPDRYPRQLSGGEQQRLALGRALASEPEILLMDEPFSNLDTDLKNELLLDLKQLLADLNITTLYVTHQLEEAIYLADRVAVMEKGKIIQLTEVEKFIEDQKNKESGSRIPAVHSGKVLHLDAARK